MGAYERITVTVPTEIATALRRSVEEGEYATESEIIRGALEDWSRVRAAEQAKVDELRLAIAEGERGPGLPAAQVFDEVRARIRGRQNAA